MRQIRRYKDEDLKACAAVLKEAFRGEPWRENWSSDLADARIQELMCSPLSMGYVFVEDDKIIGAAFGRRCTYLHGMEFFIDEMFVVPPFQRTGIGSSLIKFMANDLWDMGFVDIVLNTEREYPSEMFYLKNGFRHRPKVVFLAKDLKEDDT